MAIKGLSTEVIGLSLLGVSNSFAIWSAANPSVFTVSQFTTEQSKENARLGMNIGLGLNTVLSAGLYFAYGKKGILPAALTAASGVGLYILYEYLLGRSHVTNPHGQTMAQQAETMSYGVGSRPGNPGAGGGGGGGGGPEGLPGVTVGGGEGGGGGFQPGYYEGGTVGYQGQWVPGVQDEEGNIWTGDTHELLLRAGPPGRPGRHGGGGGGSRGGGGGDPNDPSTQGEMSPVGTLGQPSQGTAFKPGGYYNYDYDYEPYPIVPGQPGQRGSDGAPGQPGIGGSGGAGGSATGGIGGAGGAGGVGGHGFYIYPPPQSCIDHPNDPCIMSAYYDDYYAHSDTPSNRSLAPWDQGDRVITFPNETSPKPGHFPVPYEPAP